MKKKNSFTKYIKILYEQKIDFVSLAINFNSNGSMSRSTFQLSHTQQWFFLFCHHPLSLSVLVRHSMPFFLVCLCEAVFFFRLEKTTIHFDKACNFLYMLWLSMFNPLSMWQSLSSFDTEHHLSMKYFYRMLYPYACLFIPLFSLFQIKSNKKFIV